MIAPSTVPSISIEKSFLFKGGNRTWGNRYHFLGGTPADATHWHTLMDAVVAAEALVYESSQTIISATGYAAGTDVPIASKTYSTAGTGSYSTATLGVGEAAALVRYTTAARTTKNHPIYLFNYYHGVVLQNASPGVVDSLNTTYKANLATFAGKWLTGFSDGTITAVRCSPRGATATSVSVEQFATHRDFPYSRSL